MTVTLTPTDATSGVFQTYYTVDGGAQQNYSAPFTITGAGPHTITYSSVDYAANTETVKVSHFTIVSPTTTTFSATPATALHGALVTLTAKSTASILGNVVAGNVSFYNGAALMATIPLTAGTATLKVVSLPVGVRVLKAYFRGSTGFLASMSATSNVTIQQTTTTTLTSSANPSVYHQPVTLKATVHGGAGTIPTGSVHFHHGAALVGSATLNASGVGSITLSTLPVGSFGYTVTYMGDGVSKTSTSATLTQNVVKAATTTVLVSSAPTSKAGLTVTYTATVKAKAPGMGLPTGTITFKNGAAAISTVAVTAATGKAAVSVTPHTKGTYSLTAVYSGNANFTVSTSAVVKQVINVDPRTPGGTTPVRGGSQAADDWNVQPEKGGDPEELAVPEVSTPEADSPTRE